MRLRTLLSLAAVACSALGISQVPMQKLTNIAVPSAVARATYIGPTNPGKYLHVTVCLTPGDPKGLQAFVDSVSDPGDPNYHKFLTPDEIGQLYGVANTQYSAVVNWMINSGFKPTLISKNRFTVTAVCTVAQAEK